jgi:hypothetical protein
MAAWHENPEKKEEPQKGEKKRIVNIRKSSAFNPATKFFSY